MWILYCAYVDVIIKKNVWHVVAGYYVLWFLLVMCRFFLFQMAPKQSKGKGKASGSRNRRVNEHSLRNALYAGRLSNIFTRTVHPDRAIDLEDVAGTDIVRQVEGMGWRQYVTKPRDRANVSIVREFYASMIPDEFLEGKSVKVRDVDVFIRPQDINDYYEVASHDDLPNGIPDQGKFRLYDSSLAASLRREMNDSGLWDADHHLRQSELQRDMAFWSVFVSHSLKPTQQRTKIVLDIAQILYCIQNQLQIDVGRLIRLAISRAGKTEKSVIPFPCLIADLCRAAGVPERRGDDLLTMGDPCNSRTFHDLTEPQDVERLLPLGSRKRQRLLQQQGGAEGSDDEEDPGAVPADTGAPSEQRPAWFETWLAEYSQQTPSWATSLIQGQKAQQDQIAELIQVLRASTLTATERHGGAGPSTEPQEQQQDEQTHPEHDEDAH
jgi:hypothetical protein